MTILVENDPSRHFATANYRIAKGLLDHLVGDREQTRWNGKPHRFCGSHIDDEVELGRLHDFSQANIRRVGCELFSGVSCFMEA